MSHEQKTRLFLVGLTLLIGIIFLGSEFVLAEAKADIAEVTKLLKTENGDSQFLFAGALEDTQKFLQGEKEGVQEGRFLFHVTPPAGEMKEWMVSWTSAEDSYTITDIEIRDPQE